MSRRSTVYDFATLRLHPDGSRAGTSKRNTFHEVWDRRGNIRATDAAGRTLALKRPFLADHDKEEEEEDEGEVDGAPVSASYAPKDYRTAKRQRFEAAQFDFIGTPVEQRSGMCSICST